MHKHNTTLTCIIKILHNKVSCFNLIPKDVSNIMAGYKKKSLNSLSSIQHLLLQLKTRGFFFAVKVDSTTREIVTLFFAHKDQIELLKKNSDIILLDSTYKIN